MPKWGAKRAWTKADERELKGHSRAKTPLIKISKVMKRTIDALRQQAFKLAFRSATVEVPPPTASERLKIAWGRREGVFTLIYGLVYQRAGQLY